MIKHWRRNRAAIVICWLVAIAPAFGGEDREQLTAKARDGNRAAIVSIATMECSYERRPWAGTTLEQANKCFVLAPGRFRRSGDTYRLFLKLRDKTTRDYVVRNGRGLFLRQGGPLFRPALSLETLRPVDGVGGEMWQYLLFSHWGWESVSFYPFYDILEHSHVIRQAERLPPPENAIHIELTHDVGRLEFWFDPKVNYLIRKNVIIPAANKTYRWENEVIEFLEGSPAVFVPIVIEHRCFVKGTLQATIRTILSDTKVNKALAKDALRLPGIAGMECMDMNRRVKFQVDEDGNLTGPESPAEIAMITPGAEEGGGVFRPKIPASPVPASDAPLTQPSQPPTLAWQWILLVSVIVLVAALFLALVRRRRQAAQS